MNLQNSKQIQVQLVSSRAISVVKLWAISVVKQYAICVVKKRGKTCANVSRLVTSDQMKKLGVLFEPITEQMKAKLKQTRRELHSIENRSTLSAQKVFFEVKCCIFPYAGSA